MNKLTTKKRSKKGFTLVEMLIVIAIIAILVAIAIPIFNAQLNKAEERVKEANERSAASLAYAEYMLTEQTGGTTWYAVVDSNSNMTLHKSSTAPTTPANSTYYKVDITSGGAVTADYAGKIN